MAAAAHNPAFAKRAGIPQKVAREFNRADAKSGMLSKAERKTDERAGRRYQRMT